MSEEKGRRFLELVNEQNGLQLRMVGSLARLVRSGWDSAEIRAELESLVERHAEITREINCLDGGSL